jgi:glycosyltransferase involved in cell wall biosynthesis
LAKIVFYCNTSLEDLETFEYYKQDIDALKALGHELVIVNRYRDIPLRFDLLFVWWWTFALYPVILARLLRRPVIVTGTFNFRFPPGFVGVDYFVRPIWQQFLIAGALRLATLNLFVNRIELEGCREHFQVTNVGYMPHVIPDDYLQGPAPARRLELFNLAWSGSKNIERKGIPDIVRALVLVRERFPDVRLYLAGKEGDGKPILLDLIEKCELHANVVWLGALSREDKIKYMRECEIYLQPSRYEGFGLAIAEAMGSGAAVVVCPVGAVPDVVGDAGLYVQPGSPEQLADAIIRLWSDRDQRRVFQRRGVERARAEFAFNSKLERLRNFLGDLGVPSE